MSSSAVVEPGMLGMSELNDWLCTDVGGLMDAARREEDIMSYLNHSASSRSWPSVWLVDSSDSRACQVRISKFKLFLRNIMV